MTSLRWSDDPKKFPWGDSQAVGDGDVVLRYDEYEAPAKVRGDAGLTGAKHRLRLRGMPLKSEGGDSCEMSGKSAGIPYGQQPSPPGARDSCAATNAIRLRLAHGLSQRMSFHHRPLSVSRGRREGHRAVIQSFYDSKPPRRCSGPSGSPHSKRKNPRRLAGVFIAQRGKSYTPGNTPYRHGLDVDSQR
jgi:hypothetical protein